MVTRQPAHKLTSIFLLCFLFYYPACTDKTRDDTDSKKEAAVNVHVALSTGNMDRPGWETTIKRMTSDNARYFISIPVYIHCKPDSIKFMSFSDSGGGSVPDTISFELKTDFNSDKDDDDK